MSFSKKETQNGLYTLLTNDPASRDFFVSQPDYVLGMLQQHSTDVTTSKELHSRAETLRAKHF